MRTDTGYIDWDDVCFIDCETRSYPDQTMGEWENVTTTSTRRYAAGAYPIVITWAYGLEGKVKRWETPDIRRAPRRSELPEELLGWDGYFCAHNSGFDRAILDPEFGAGAEGWIDMMAQCAASGLPFGLDMAAKACGHDGKIASGKNLIRMFCTPDGETPESKPEQWAEFLEYADVDVEAMQHIAASTLPLPRWQWEEFWASERINDRGLPMDPDVLRGGALLAAAYDAQTAERIKDITDGEMYSARQYVKQREWVFERVRGLPMVMEHMVKAHRQHPDTGEDEYKLQMDRPRITKLIAALETVDADKGLTDEEAQALDFLDEREFGASATPAKFAKAAAALMPDNTLPNQYVFNGAAQTGRFSSRGVQVHNLTNKTVGDYDTECDVADFMVEVAHGAEPDLLHVEDTWGNPGRVLSRMIRPAITAPEGKLICWGDWSNIEARVLPWLACAEPRLDIFRAIDADPANTPDVYLQAAAGMYDHDPYDLLQMKIDGAAEVKPIRQRGKIAELALGFAGGAGALQSMAAGYGMIFEAEEAQDIVGRWRAANQWAVEFWDRLWDAFVTAMKNPGDTVEVGRVSYQCIEGYLGRKTVVCLLPDGRPLVYRNVHMKEFVERDEFEPEIIIEKTQQLVFHGPDGVKKLWKGLLAENITQATAASVLRWTQRSWTPEEEIQPIVGHTHDELLTLTDEADKEDAEERLRVYMEQDFGWNAGLPTAADVQSNVCYTKALDD